MNGDAPVQYVESSEATLELLETLTPEARTIRRARMLAFVRELREAGRRMYGFDPHEVVLAAYRSGELVDDMPKSEWTWDLDERTDAGVRIDRARSRLVWWAADKILPGMTAHMVSGGERDQPIGDFLAGKPAPWRCPDKVLAELRAALG